MPAHQSNWIVLARLLRPQGRKGELLAQLLTDFPERFTSGLKVFVGTVEADAPSPKPVEMQLTTSWLAHGKNEGRIVLGFQGVHSIDQAERVAGLDVLVPETDRLQLTDDSVYISDLIGCAVFDRGNEIGIVADVQFMTTTDGKRRLADAAPLLIVESSGGEAMIPFVRDLIVSLDVDGKRISMSLPEGLVDLNSKPVSPVRTEEPLRET